MAYSRRSTLDIKQVTGLLEQAGWDIRNGSSSGHLVASKAGEGVITLGTPLHKNTIAQVQQVIGVHLKTLLNIDRGKRPSRSAPTAA